MFKLSVTRICQRASIKDTLTTPFGQIITKQQYWLNNNEVQDVIDVTGKAIELNY